MISPSSTPDFVEEEVAPIGGLATGIHNRINPKIRSRSKSQKDPGHLLARNCGLFSKAEDRMEIDQVETSRGTSSLVGSIPKQTTSRSLISFEAVEATKIRCPAPPGESNSTSITKGFEKNEVLANYESINGENTTSDQTRIHGESPSTIILPPYIQNLPSRHELVRDCKMKPSPKKQYRIKGPSGEDMSQSELTLSEVAVSLVKYCICKSKKGMFPDEWDEQIAKLACLNKAYASMVYDVRRLYGTDVSLLRMPRVNFESQREISEERMDMATAVLIAYDMEPGQLVRYMNGEYTGQSRDVDALEEAIGQHVSPEDMQQIRRILTEGCPCEMDFEESQANKRMTLERGNQKSFEGNPVVAKKTLNKEEKNSNVLPVRGWAPMFSASMRATPQGINDKGVNARVVWDGSTTLGWEEIALNEVTPMEGEAEVTFGQAKMEMYKRLYNMRVSFPLADILLAWLDIKACFRFPRIHPDLTGCFGYTAFAMYLLTTSNVFGSVMSAASWEPFRRAIIVMTAVFFGRLELLEKHKDLLDMIEWESYPAPTESFVRAAGCELNPGVQMKDGRFVIVINGVEIYVDDILVAAPDKESMRMTLAAAIEAIFVVMGFPEPEARQCHLAMDKWESMKPGPTQTMLGLNLNTRRMVVGMTPEYRANLHDIMRKHWHKGRKTFKIKEMLTLVGKLARLGEGAQWVYKLMAHMYVSLAEALSGNKQLLGEVSDDYKKLLEDIRCNRFVGKPSEVAKQVNFAMKKAARMPYHANFLFPIRTRLRIEMDFFKSALEPNSGIEFETPIAHIIKRMPLAKAYGDSALQACGGYCTTLRFWWHLAFPDEVKEKTLLHLKNNDNDDLIDINCLEYVTIIINYCAALVVLEKEPVDDPYPVLLAITDNTSALNWTVHTAKKSRIGRALARLFCGLLMGSPLGINSEWIATDLNDVADGISRFIKQENESRAHANPHYCFDYTTLQQRYPVLRDCRFFHPSQELLSMIWDILLTRKLPDPREVRELKQSGLGRLAI